MYIPHPPADPPIVSTDYSIIASYLHTVAPPDVVTISGPSSVTEGQSFQLTCSANGWPPPSYEVCSLFKDVISVH